MVLALLAMVAYTKAYTISVNNGLGLGDWGPESKCSDNRPATGFIIQVESNQGKDAIEGDHTALNGNSINLF